MKIYSWLVVLLFAALRLSGQINLVKNPSFEEVYLCPSDSFPTKPKYWYNPTQGSPDFFFPTPPSNQLCQSMSPAFWGTSMYSNNWGYTLPRTGIAYAGMAVSQGSELMAGQLSDSLIGGQHYHISFYTSLGDAYFANNGGQGLDLISISFHEDSVSEYGSNWWQFLGNLSADAGNFPGNFLSDTSRWMLVQDTFVAQGGERYFVIGNIDTANTQYYNSNTPTPCYYYFDDFDIHCIDCEDTSAPPPPRPPAFQLFPNHNDGVFSISGPFMPQDRIVVYDAVGRLIFSYAVTQENNLLQLFPQLATGVYVCRVERSEELLFKRRVVVAE